MAELAAAFDVGLRGRPVLIGVLGLLPPNSLRTLPY